MYYCAETWRAIGFIVGGMKVIIPAILDFFAKLLNINGIVDAVKNVINKIVGPIHAAIDKMVDWLKGVLNKVVDKVKGVFGKKEEKKPAEKEQRSQDQMKKDLSSGIGEATSYLRSGSAKKKDDINKYFNQIESKYGLTDLQVIIDKHNETGKDTVHVHGKINPEENGDKVEVDLDDPGKIKLKEAIEKAEVSDAEVEAQIQKLIDAGAKSSLFRGDNNYDGEGVGLPLGSEDAKKADIQDAYTHIQDNEGQKSSIYRSFSIRKAMPQGNDPQKFARKDKIFKVELEALKELVKQGVIKIYTPNDIKNIIDDGSSKGRRLANAVFDAMNKNGEILIKGHIPKEFISKTN